MSAAIYSFINSITNTITSRYDIKAQISSAGLWKIYLGLRKTTGKHVAVFIFEKRSLDSIFKRERGASRNDTERVYELLKKEASYLARLRHPSILEVVEPVSESRSSIAFVTEPLMGTLSHLLKMDNSYSSQGSDATYEVDELEIQKGLLQVGKGLQFLNDAKVVHHNLTPDAIFVNAKGDWKIGGLGFGVFLNNTSDPQSTGYFNDEYLPEACQINLDYAAPEFILDNEVTQANDMFSLGCLAYAVHNKGVPLLHTFNNLRTYERKIQALGTMDFSHMPVHLQDVIRRLLARYPSQRISSIEFQNSKYFDNLLVSTMKFLENFPEKTREEKGQFMKGLARVLNQFPERVLKRKILPSLLEELKNHPLLPYTVPNVFIIAQKLTEREFCDLVLPALKPVFGVRDPPQNMIVLLEKLDVLQEKTPREVFRDDIMPLVYAALEAPTPVVQEKALRIIPSLAESLDYTTVKSSLFPRVQVLFAQTTILSVKVSTLICFHSMIKVIDKYTMQEKLVPLLKNIKTKEPAVMLATLAVYDEMGKHLDKEIIATEILPQLWRMSFGPLLNVDQFKKFMKTIRELTTRVEEAHTRHLQEVKSLEEQTKSVSKAGSSSGNGAAAGADTELSFEALVQGRVDSNKRTTPDIFSSSNANDFSGKKTAGIAPMTSATTSTATSTFDGLSSGWSSPGRQSPLMGLSMDPLSPSNNNNNTASSPVRQPATMQQTLFTSNTTTSWSTTPTTSNIPTLLTPPSFQSAPPPLAPPVNAMNSLTMQPTQPSGPNYAALRDLGTSLSPKPAGRPSSMELLQPVSIHHNTRPPATTQNQNQPGHKMSNLNAFDPLL